jgi:hypothetical protein
LRSIPPRKRAAATGDAGCGGIALRYRASLGGTPDMTDLLASNVILLVRS